MHDGKDEDAIGLDSIEKTVRKPGNEQTAEMAPEVRMCPPRIARGVYHRVCPREGSLRELFRKRRWKGDGRRSRVKRAGDPCWRSAARRVAGGRMHTRRRPGSSLRRRGAAAHCRAAGFLEKVSGRWRKRLNAGIAIWRWHEPARSYSMKPWSCRSKSEPNSPQS